jgi:hypothetical protein
MNKTNEINSNVVISALAACETVEAIEDTFRRFEVEDQEDRIDKLNKCMGSPQTFFSSDAISVPDKYELTIQMFLTMSWKLNEYYKRMGIGLQIQN